MLEKKKEQEPSYYARWNWPRWNYHNFETGTEVNLRFYGLCAPALEASLGDDMEGTYSVTCKLGLFGVSAYVGVRKVPEWLKRHVGKWNTRSYGVYTCETHIAFMWHHRQDGYEGKPGYHKLWDWETLLKGDSDTTKLPADPMVTIEIPTIARSGYPVETLTLEVRRVPYMTTYRRWRTLHWERWEVKSIKGEAVVPGKGENGWDCDDEYGIDMSLCSKDIHNAWDAARAAIQDLDKIRGRR